MLPTAECRLPGERSTLPVRRLTQLVSHGDTVLQTRVVRSIFLVHKLPHLLIVQRTHNAVIRTCTVRNFVLSTAMSIITSRNIVMCQDSRSSVLPTMMREFGASSLLQGPQPTFNHCCAACSTSFSRPPSTTQYKPTYPRLLSSELLRFSLLLNLIARLFPALPIARSPHHPAQTVSLSTDICNKSQCTLTTGLQSVRWTVDRYLPLPRYCTKCPATLSLPFHFCPFASHSV